jgi:hypothetical protein
LTALSSTVFVSAEPRVLESRAASVVRTVDLDSSKIERGRYLGGAAPVYAPPGQVARTQVVKFPAG